MLALELGKTHKLPKAREAELREQLANWTSIHFYLPTWSLPDVEKALFIEKNGEARPRVMRRLIARRSTLVRENDLASVGLV